MCSRICGRDSKVPARLHHHQFRPKYKEKYTRIKYMKFDLGLHIKLRHLNSWVELQTQPFFNNSFKLSLSHLSFSLFSSLFYLLFLFFSFSSLCCLLSPLSPPLLSLFSSLLFSLVSCLISATLLPKKTFFGIFFS